MKDTPRDAQEIQLKIWLDKMPGERLFQFLTDNEAMYKAILKAKEEIKNNLPASS